jgi:hypothetical protein
MSTLPMYVWVIVLVGLIGTTAAICVMLWRGALTAGRCRRTATRVAAVTGIVWAAWAVANAALADAGVLRFAPGRTLPGIPMAVIARLAVAFVITRVLPIARILAEPDALWGLTLQQMFRPVGAAFLVAMALGQLPAVFAVPAGFGDFDSSARPHPHGRGAAGGDTARVVATEAAVGRADQGHYSHTC